MKTKSKTSILLLTFILNVTSLFSQTPWYLGGNSVSSVSNFGTISNFDLPFVTNSTEKARLLNTGEFGLGTTTPASWLHIAPSGSSESFRTVSSSINTADAWKMFRGTQEIGRLWFGISANAFNINGTRGPLHFLTG